MLSSTTAAVNIPVCTVIHNSTAEGSHLLLLQVQPLMRSQMAACSLSSVCPDRKQAKAAKTTRKCSQVDMHLVADDFMQPRALQRGVQAVQTYQTACFLAETLKYCKQWPGNAARWQGDCKIVFRYGMATTGPNFAKHAGRALS